MSVAIAVRGNKHGIFMGVDSAVVMLDEYENNISLVDPRLNPKIMQVGEYLIAGVGSPRLLNILRYAKWPKVPAKAYETAEAAMAHVVNCVVPSIQNVFDCNQIIAEQMPGATIYHGQLLVAFGSHLFDITAELGVIAYNSDYIVIGAASAIARGAMHIARRFVKHPEDQIRLALQAASHHTTVCAEPFTVLSTEGAE